jgi:2-dehydro-3-deoxyphosphogluconate aldolase/(4S)-4-hydroxy-2-oxoglutarate aldolase
MAREKVLNDLLNYGAIAVIRMKEKDKVFKVVEAIVKGGVKCIEITMTVPGAIDIINELSKIYRDDIIIGAGTVLSTESSKEVIEAGARFVVGPVFIPQIIKICHDNDVVAIPGCFSPTEIFNAWVEGADIVKIFPANVLGPRYLSDLKNPLPELRLLPTGGVTVENVGEWIEAGADAVAIGTALLDKKAIEEGRYEILEEKARKLVNNIMEARNKKQK